VALARGGRGGRVVGGRGAHRNYPARLIVSILEEVPVVVKRLRVVEELHIERRRQTVRRPQRVAVGREDPTIEREPALPEPRNRENHRPGRRYGGRNA
jgi:hypothetical protein